MRVPANQDETGDFTSKVEAVRARIIKEVEHGLFAGRNVLPGERELALTLGVSRTTLRRSLADLIQSGFLGQRQGYGTFVAQTPASPSQSEPHPSGFTQGPGDHFLAVNDTIGINNQTLGLSAPRPDEAVALDLAVGTRVWRACRILIDGQSRPFAWERIVAAEPALGTSPAPDGWLSILDRRGFGIRRCRRRICIGSLNDFSSQQNTNGIFTEQRGFAADDRPRIVWFMSQLMDSFDVVVDLPSGS